MSVSKLEEIRCPCGEVFEAELWNSINISEDPELKEALKSGEINVVCCPACSEIFYADHFILYLDPPNELLAFVYPSSFSGQAARLVSKMKEDFRRAMEDIAPDERIAYEPLLMFGLDTLADLIHAEEEEADETTILEYSAEDLGLTLLRLKPSCARPLQLPRILPRQPLKHGDLREEIIAGLRRLLRHNGHLSRYQKLLETIESNTQWTLDETVIAARSKTSKKHT